MEGNSKRVPSLCQGCEAHRNPDGNRDVFAKTIQITADQNTFVFHLLVLFTDPLISKLALVSGRHDCLIRTQKGKRYMCK